MFKISNIQAKIPRRSGKSQKVCTVSANIETGLHFQLSKHPVIDLCHAMQLHRISLNVFHESFEFSQMNSPNPSNLRKPD